MSFGKIAMLIMAIFLDVIGFILFIFDFAGVGNIFSFLLDIFGFLTVGLWLILKGRSLPSHVGKRLAKRLKIAIVSELIPFWGDICPSWTILVTTTKE